MKTLKNRKKQNNRAIGTAYERRAGEYLKSRGYEILEYNFRCPLGEIDMIARDGEYLVFCEVKYRSRKGSGHGMEAVNMKKQRTVSKCAAYYLTAGNLWRYPSRFDVVSIDGGEITLVKNAFDAVF